MSDDRNPHACKIFWWCLRANLSSQQTQIIISRYMSHDNLDTIGKRYGLTKQRISQIEIAALKKLRRRVDRLGV